MSNGLPVSSQSPDAASLAVRQNLEARLRIIVPALRKRFGGEWAGFEIDLVLIHYVYGLVDVAYPEAPADLQLETLHHLAGPMLDDEARHVAIHATPPRVSSSNSHAVQLARAISAAEALGRRDALAVLAMASDGSDGISTSNETSRTAQPGQ